MHTEISLKEFNKKITINIALLVATDIEKETALKYLYGYPENEETYIIYNESLTYYCGLFGKYSTVIVKTNKMGSSQRGASLQVSSKLIKAFSPKILLMPGIAFGKDKTKQKIGDILVSDSLALYEPSRINEDGSINFRGPTPEANEILVNRFSEDSSFNCDYKNENKVVKVIKGLLLSGEKLIDNSDFKLKLLAQYPTAIGGEMEGAGVYSSSDTNQIPWIIIKSICDWADGDKNKKHQEFAAYTCLQYIQRKFESSLIFESLHVLPYKTHSEERQEIKIDASDILKKIVSPRNYKKTIDDMSSSRIISRNSIVKNKSTKKIHYEYYYNNDNGRLIGYLFLGKNITIKNVLEEFKDKYPIPDVLEIYLTKSYNKTTNKMIDRKHGLFERLKEYELDKISKNNIHYIDDFIWDLSDFNSLLDSNYNSDDDIDQLLYSYSVEEDKEFVILERSIEFFENSLMQEHTPVSVIFGSGGVGKSTFTKALENKINKNSTHKRVFLIKGERIEFCPTENISINSLEDLFLIYKEEAGFSSMSAEDFNLNVISGNIIVIIDALDEIEAALNTQINLEKLFLSLYKLEERFFSTKIIITTREQFKSKINISNTLNIKYYALKGFTEEDLTTYLNTKYNHNSNKNALINSFLIKHRLKNEKLVIPLFVHWACKILDNSTNTDLIGSKSVYFLNTTIDKLIMELINREKVKKNLAHIEIDDFFEILQYISVTNRGEILLQDLFEFCKDLEINEHNCRQIIDMTIFEVTSTSLKLKYDIFHNLIKSRYLKKALESQYPINDELIKLYKEIYLGNNELFEELTEIVDSSKILQSITSAIKKLVTVYNSDSSSGTNIKTNIKKSISGLLYLLMKKEYHSTSEDRSDLLMQVYNNDISNLFIYGDFYTLSFLNIKVKNSLFDSYKKFNKCSFPEEKSTIFSNSYFCNITCDEKLKLEELFFKKCTYKDTNIPEIINLTSTNSKNKKDTVKDNLKALTKYIDTNQKSLNYIKQRVNIKYAKGAEKYVIHLVKEGYLEKIIHNGRDEYKIHDKYQDCIEDVKNGSFGNEIMEELIEILSL